MLKSLYIIIVNAINACQLDWQGKKIRVLFVPGQTMKSFTVYAHVSFSVMQIQKRL